MAHTRERTYRSAAFSLLELAVVLVVVGIVTAMAMNSGNVAINASRETATRQKMKALEDALQAYREANNRLPCPASLTIAEGVTNFGVEGATPGTCTGGTPAANNSAAGETNTSKTGVEGAVPVVTLGLPNDFMYDGWGRRIRYTVDKSATSANAFTSIASKCTDLAVTIKDGGGNSRTDGAIYALISHGENGHGGYTKNGVITNAGSTNTDEQTNCHCTSAAAAGTYAPTYVQKQATVSTSSATDTYDDIVTYKERWQLKTTWEAVASCSGTQYVYVVDSNNNRIQVFDLNGNFVTKFGSYGSGDGQFYFTYTGGGAVTVDSSGYVYVADIDNDRIQKFTSTGTFISKFGTYGSADGQLNGPWGIAIDGSGNIWVAEYWGNRVQKFDSNGNYLLKFGSSGTGDSQFDPVVCIATYGNHVYVCDHHNNRVQKFDLSGTYVTQYALTGGPYTVRPFRGIAFDSTGNMYVGNSWWLEVTKFNAAGTYQASIGAYGGTGPGYFYGNVANAVDAQGNIWVTDSDNNRVQKFDSSGTWLLSIGGPSPHTCQTSPSGSAPACAAGTDDGQFDSPYGIAVGPP